MSKRKAIQKEYKRKARLLKKHKLIDYDLRKELSPAQMAAITKKWAGKKDHDGEGHHGGFGYLIENKKDKYIHRHVSKKRARQLKELGYPVHGQRVYIDKEGFDNIHIRGDQIIKQNDEKRIKDFLLGGADILKELEKRLNKNLKPNETVTVRIGNNSPFRTALPSYESLLNYVSNWQPKADFNRRDELIGLMSLVEFIEK